MFLPRNVYEVLDSFFTYSVEDEYLPHMQDGEGQSYINRKIRISEMVDVNKLHSSVAADEVDVLLGKYIDGFLQFEVEDNIEIIKDMDFKYLPLECLKICISFDDLKETGFEEAVALLVSEYGENTEIELLRAEWLIHNEEDATALLSRIYRELPPMDYPFTYRLMRCCEKAGMLYESYMLLKHLTWLVPKSYMHDLADELCQRIEAKYKNTSDIEHIHMCRMYLRSNREARAISILSKVKDTAANLWEYHMAKCLSYFNEEDMEEAFNSYEILMDFPKNELNVTERLEWEELQGRYLFEKKEYIKCINKCNKVLKEYPNSYPVRILRSYADYNIEKYSKRYADMGALNRIFPKRVEINLFLACVCGNYNEYNNAVNILKPVKGLCEIQYLYYQTELIEEEDYNRYRKNWLKILSIMSQKELYISSVSKYGMLDLKKIFINSTDADFYQETADEYEKNIEKILKSKYNNPEKYVDMYRYYSATEQYEKALAEAKKNTNKMHIIESYSYLGELDLLEHELMNINNEDFEEVDDIAECYYYAAKAYLVADRPDEAEYCILKSIELAPWYRRYYAYAGSIYLFWGDRDSSKYAKGVEILEECLSKFGKYVASSRNEHIYSLLAVCYGNMGLPDKGKEILDRMYKYSKYETFRTNYYKYISDMYKDACDAENAYKYYLIAMEKGCDCSPDEEAFYLMRLGQYEKAYELLIEIARTDTDPDVYAWKASLHCKYLMDGYLEKEYVLMIINIMEEKLKDTESQIGPNYYSLAQIYHIYGDKKKEDYYIKLAENCFWEDECSHKREKQSYIMWNYWCDKKYEEAYQYYKNVYYIDSEYELGCLKYFMRKMFENHIY